MDAGRLSLFEESYLRWRQGGEVYVESAENKDRYTEWVNVEIIQRTSKNSTKLPPKVYCITITYHHKQGMTKYHFLSHTDQKLFTATDFSSRSGLSQ